MTPRELVARIVSKAGAEGTPQPTVPSRRDTFKTGDPDAAITGIATTGMTTFSVLRRAVAAKCNFIISHEDTWFRDDDNPDFLAGDAIYEAKKRFIEEHGLIIWRDHDLAHRMVPDQVFAGQLQVLGWKADAIVPPPPMPLVTLPQPMNLAALVRYAAARCKTQAHRVTGDPAMIVRRVAIGVGYAFPSFPTLPADVDAIVGGETAEGSANAMPTIDETAWAADMSTLGRPRGIVLLGHMGTEDLPLILLADWIRDIAAPLPVTFIPAGEAFAPPFGPFRQTA
ncbi:Nif3-like dinuclear metal center hexameric protein [Sphingomonas sp.]|uniref:Nif3-like dinuclear metal center hexameric protein n=1 Tax=Sphingomonas sp. TaxID=28214 RepID=UPI000DB4FD14|nr:Nif3-like dinuclear metal center hexameric protein [Sphingomonas sp.]PZU08764.1 MAG: hypothetical protein DI605_12605 [Sphingomonas sp.]